MLATFRPHRLMAVGWVLGRERADLLFLLH